MIKIGVYIKRFSFSIDLTQVKLKSLGSGKASDLIKMDITFKTTIECEEVSPKKSLDEMSRARELDILLEFPTSAESTKIDLPPIIQPRRRVTSLNRLASCLSLILFIDMVLVAFEIPDSRYFPYICFDI